MDISLETSHAKSHGLVLLRHTVLIVDLFGQNVRYSGT